MASAAEGRRGRGAADGAKRAGPLADGGRGRQRRRLGGAGRRSETPGTSRQEKGLGRGLRGAWRPWGRSNPDSGAWRSLEGPGRGHRGAPWSLSEVGEGAVEETLRCGPLRVGETGCGPLQGCRRGAGKRVVLPDGAGPGGGGRG